MLDLSPRNELGKDILGPAVESKLWRLASPMPDVFHADGKFHLRTATTPISAVAANVLKPAKMDNTLVLIMSKSEKAIEDS